MSGRTEMSVLQTLLWQVDRLEEDINILKNHKNMSEEDRQFLIRDTVSSRCEGIVKQIKYLKAPYDIFQAYSVSAFENFVIKAYELTKETQSQLNNEAFNVAEEIISYREKLSEVVGNYDMSEPGPLVGFMPDKNIETMASLGAVAQRIKDNLPKIKQMLTEKGYSNVRMFGSVARGEEKESSDLDLLVTPPNDSVSIFEELAFCDEIADILHVREVQLVPEGNFFGYAAENVKEDLITIF